jgi:hypothetical protein
MKQPDKNFPWDHLVRPLSGNEVKGRGNEDKEGKLEQTSMKETF